MFDRLKAVIEEKLNAEGVEITEKTDFKEDLNADSLDLFELVMALEEEFGTEIPSEDLEKLAFDAAYSCGSKRLMGEMHQLHLRCGFESYVSLEEHMACGIGACKGCVCRTRGEDGGERYETVCQCGPVFPTERIV